MAEPNWDLANADPESFFELDEGCDRRQLKRSYSRLIRQYKPETHPKQFQLIRQAYERVEERLRYGRMLSQNAEPTEQIWAQAVTKSDPLVANASADSTSSSSTSLWQTVRATSPATLYQELQRKEQPSPYEYYALALLSDVVDRQQPMMFYRWLLTGLKKHPDDRGLFNLVFEYCRSDLPDDLIAKALVATSRVVSTDRFYFLTEPLWDRLLAKVDAKTFCETLKHCEKQLRDHRIQGKLVFYVQMLRRGLWKLEGPWFEEKVKWLSEHGSELYGEVEADYDFLLLAIEYRDLATQFAEGSSIRASMGQAIRDYCELSIDKARETVVSCQNEIGRNAQAVMDAFEPGDTRWQVCTSLYQMVVNEVSPVIDRSAKRAEPKSARKQSAAMIEDMREEIHSVGVKISWTQFAIHIIAAATLAIVPPAMVWGFVSGAAFGLFAVLWIVVAIVVYAFVIRPWIVQPRLQKRIEKRLRKLYVHSWRGRLFRYLQVVSMSLDDALANTYQTAINSGDADWLSYLFYFQENDLAVRLYSQAQSSLR